LSIWIKFEILSKLSFLFLNKGGESYVSETGWKKQVIDII